MGGTIWVESRVGEGSTFHFTIEAVEAPAPAPAHERGAPPQLRGRRVLIVDDNPTNRHILRRQAGSWGMLARETAYAAQALRWIGQGDPFDLTARLAPRRRRALPEEIWNALSQEPKPQPPAGRPRPGHPSGKGSTVPCSGDADASCSEPRRCLPASR